MPTAIIYTWATFVTSPSKHTRCYLPLATVAMAIVVISAVAIAVITIVIGIIMIVTMPIVAIVC